MDYRRLGNAGLEVSRICLGCMSYGDAARSVHPWTIDEAESRKFFSAALDAGINFFDTANVYSNGSSEEFLGRWLQSAVSRDDVVIATKVHGRMRPGPNGAGLSRKAIFNEIDNSLRRLGTDYVDLYQIHRWDPDTPIEEIMQALHDVVAAGKARYIGASSMFAWQFAKAQHVAAMAGTTRFVSMQDHYNLLYREEEREMIPMCVDQGIGLLPWSPLARGRLSRPWRATTARSETDAFGQALYSAADRAIVDGLEQLAGRSGISMAIAALAWLLSRPGVVAPIVGATRLTHLDDAVAALSVTLDAEGVAELEALYRPQPTAGFG